MPRPSQAALLFLLALLLPAAAAAQEALEVPFELHRARRAMLVEARVNGKPVMLIVDTGATHTVLAPEAVGLREMDLKLAQVAGNAPGMRGEATWARADLRLGEITWRKRPVVAMNLSEVSRIFGRPIHGILGQDVLMEFRRVVVDFREKKLILQR